MPQHNTPTSRLKAIPLLRPGEQKARWLGLYLATLALQLPFAMLRAAISYPVLWLALKLAGAPTGAAEPLSIALAYGPLAVSAATLILPFGGLLWQQHQDGRCPAAHEQLAFDYALAELRRHDPTLRAPKRWFVYDSDDADASSRANTLAMTSSLLENGHLTPILAHELFHLNTSDARLAAAIGRLNIPPRSFDRALPDKLARLWSGSLGLWPLDGAWDRYWTKRYQAADAYATKLGQGPALAAFRTEHEHHEPPIPRIWLEAPTA